MMVNSMEKQILFSKTMYLDQTLKDTIYPKLVETYKWSLYMADKCKWE